MAYRSILFYASATLFAATIPKHLHVGLHKIAPATKSIAQTEANKKVRNLITPTWLHSAVYLAMSGKCPLRKHSVALGGELTRSQRC